MIPSFRWIYTRLINYEYRISFLPLDPAHWTFETDLKLCETDSIRWKVAEKQTDSPEKWIHDAIHLSEPRFIR